MRQIICADNYSMMVVDVLNCSDGDRRRFHTLPVSPSFIYSYPPSLLSRFSIHCLYPYIINPSHPHSRLCPALPALTPLLLALASTSPQQTPLPKTQEKHSRSPQKPNTPMPIPRPFTFKRRTHWQHQRLSRIDLRNQGIRVPSGGPLAALWHAVLYVGKFGVGVRGIEPQRVGNIGLLGASLHFHFPLYLNFLLIHLTSDTPPVRWQICSTQLRCGLPPTLPYRRTP
jgi:hypothetical protein